MARCIRVGNSFALEINLPADMQLSLKLKRQGIVGAELLAAFGFDKEAAMLRGWQEAGTATKPSDNELRAAFGIKEKS